MAIYGVRPGWNCAPYAATTTINALSKGVDNANYVAGKNTDCLVVGGALSAVLTVGHSCCMDIIVATAGTTTATIYHA